MSEHFHLEKKVSSKIFHHESMEDVLGPCEHAYRENPFHLVLELSCFYDQW